MEISFQSVVTLTFILTDVEGNVLDQSVDSTFTYIHGMGRILPGLEKALEGKQAGDNVEVELPPHEAFGERIPDFTEIAPRRLFKGTHLEPGMTFQARDKQNRMMPLRIVRIEGDDVHVDANHPMAGLTLYFNVDIVDVREATAEERQSPPVQ